MKKNVSRPEFDLFGVAEPVAPAPVVPEAPAPIGERAVGVEVRAQRMREALSALSTASTRFGMGAAYDNSWYQGDIDRRYRPNTARVVSGAVANGESALSQARDAFYGAYFGTWAMTDEVKGAIPTEAHNAWEDFYSTFGGAAGAPARTELEKTLGNQIAGYQEAHLIPEYAQ